MDATVELTLMDRLAGWLVRLGWSWQAGLDGSVKLLDGETRLGYAWDDDPPSIGSWYCRLKGEARGMVASQTRGRSRKVALLELLTLALLRWVDELGVWRVSCRPAGEVALERLDDGASVSGVMRVDGVWTTWGMGDPAEHEDRCAADADFADRAMRVADGLGLVPGAAAPPPEDDGEVDVEQLERTRRALGRLPG